MDSDLEDEQLLKRCQGGDESAIEILIQRYQKRVFGLAQRIANDSAQAEEIATETFFKVWTKSRTWNGEASVAAWIYRIAIRTALDSQRGHRRWRRRVELFFKREQPPPALDPSEQAIAAESSRRQSDQLASALDTLSPDDRTLIHLFYFEEKPLAEIEPILEVTRDALKMRLSRIRKRLRELLKPTPE